MMGQLTFGILKVSIHLDSREQDHPRMRLLLARVALLFLQAQWLRHFMATLGKVLGPGLSRLRPRTGAEQNEVGSS